MEFQIQVQFLGTSRERAQISFVGSHGVVHLEAEITEWSTSTPKGDIRAVQGRLPNVEKIDFVRRTP